MFSFLNWEILVKKIGENKIRSLIWWSPLIVNDQSWIQNLPNFSPFFIFILLPTYLVEAFDWDTLLTFNICFLKGCKNAFGHFYLNHSKLLPCRKKEINKEIRENVWRFRIQDWLLTCHEQIIFQFSLNFLYCF